MVCLFRFVTDIISTSHLAHTLGSNFILPRSASVETATCRPLTYTDPIRLPRISPFSATEKHTETGGNSRFAYALSEMQGWRLSTFQTTSTFFLLSWLQSALLFFFGKMPSLKVIHDP